ncbi:MAG TPA: hypothetical protein VFZ09_17635 [Archangium sp.]|uniref:hypothetical protein n=1 Tax=Archangium sp. TaxID=1872627 RepID=UPI002E340D50|nr:hypothetical protein [Archangium sp.]HEX5748068.1 hypothetical protein [Archangium sp.]
MKPSSASRVPPPDECLGFIYRYGTVLPEGLLPRFIVETYVHREPKHARRSGAVLKRAIGKLQAIQPGGKPVNEHDKTDPAWLEVTKQLDRVLAKLKRS